MTRNRSISSIVGNKPSLRSTRQKAANKVHCYCSKCNGKLVLKRTKLFHDSEKRSTTVHEDFAESRHDEKELSSNLAESLSQT